MNISIRPAGPRDCGEIIKLLTQIAAHHHTGRPEVFKPGSKKYNEADLLNILNDTDRPVFVADDGEGHVAGYCFCQILRYDNHAVYRDHTALYIDDFCVNETLRGHGIGQQLFKTVHKYAKEIGALNLELNVWEFNESAVRFYEKCGFSTRSRRMELFL